MYIIHILKNIDYYLKGNSANQLYKQMRYYDNNLLDLRRDFYTLTIDPESPLLQDAIQSILITLAIPKKKWPRYLESKLTVYNFFLELSKENCIQANYILELIKEKKKARLWYLLIAGLFAFCLVVALLSLPIFSELVRAIRVFFTSPLCLPVAGFLFNIGLSGWHIYASQFDKKKTLFNRFRDNFFLVTNAILNFIAYGLWIAMMSAMSPLIASLFVSASMIEVVKEIFCLVQTTIEYKNNRVKNFFDSSFQSEQARVRYDTAYQKHLNAAVVNLVSAVLLVGIMAFWCFAFGGIVITLSAVASIVVVYALRFSLLKKNDSLMRERLQQQLKNIEEKHEIDTESSVALSNKLKFKTVPSSSPAFFEKPDTVLDEDSQLKERSRYIPTV